MDTITIVLPIKVVSELNAREHWRSRHRRRQQQRIRMGFALCKYRNKLPWPAVVTFTRIAPRKIDSHDNLRSSFKGLVDEIAKFSGHDDGCADWDWRYAQEQGNPKEYAVRIEIREV